MSDELKHECAVAMVVLRKPPSATGDFGGTKLSLLLEKQHNRGQDGAGAAILRATVAAQLLHAMTAMQLRVPTLPSSLRNPRNVRRSLSGI